MSEGKTEQSSVVGPSVSEVGGTVKREKVEMDDDDSDFMITGSSPANKAIVVSTTAQSNL